MSTVQLELWFVFLMLLITFLCHTVRLETGLSVALWQSVIIVFGAISVCSQCGFFSSWSIWFLSVSSSNTHLWGAVILCDKSVFSHFYFLFFHFILAGKIGACSFSALQSLLLILLGMHNALFWVQVSSSLIYDIVFFRVLMWKVSRYNLYKLKKT